MKRTILGVTVKDKKINEGNKQKQKYSKTNHKIITEMVGINTDKWTRIIIEWKLQAGKKRTCRPLTPWYDNIQKPVKKKMQTAQNRGQWKI